MSPAALSPSLTRRHKASRRGSRVRVSAPNPANSRRGEAIASGRPLARYVDGEGRTRELVALDGHGGSVLVLDRDGVTLCDRRLLAHLAADEPRENAMLVCRHYLQDPEGRWCRGVRPEDLEIVPFARVAAYVHWRTRKLRADANTHQANPRTSPRRSGCLCDAAS
jgi:hypothetical protein